MDSYKSYVIQEVGLFHFPPDMFNPVFHLGTSHQMRRCHHHLDSINYHSCGTGEKVAKIGFP